MVGHDGRRGFINYTAVLPKYRNQGIARKLVDAAMSALDAEDIKKVALVVFRKNELGNGFGKISDLKTERIWCTGTKISMHWRGLTLNVTENDNDD